MASLANISLKFVVITEALTRAQKILSGFAGSLDSFQAKTARMNSTFNRGSNDLVKGAMQFHDISKSDSFGYGWIRLADITKDIYQSIRMVGFATREFVSGDLKNMRWSLGQAAARMSFVPGTSKRALGFGGAVGGGFLQGPGGSGYAGPSRLKNFTENVIPRFASSPLVASINASFLVATGSARVFAGVLGQLYTIANAIVQPLLSIGGVAVAAFAGATYAVYRFVESQYEGIMRTQRMAREMGTSYQQMRLFTELGERSGVPMHQLERWLGHLETELGGVTNGSYEAIRLFRLINVDGAALANLPMDEAFLRVLNTIRQLPNQYERVRVAHLLFGRDFRRVLDLVNSPSAANMEGLQATLRASGQMLSPADLAQVETAYNSLRNLQLVIQGFTQQVAVGLAPVVQVITDNLVRWGSTRDGIAATRSAAIVLLEVFVQIGITIARLSDYIDTFGDRFQASLGGIADTASQISRITRIFGINAVANAAGIGPEQTIATMQQLANAARQRIAARGLAAADGLENGWNRVRTQIEAAIAAAEILARHGAAFQGMMDRTRTPAGQAGIVGQFLSGNSFAPLAQMNTVLSSLPNAAGALSELLNRASQLRTLPWVTQMEQSFRTISEATRQGVFTPNESSLATLQEVERFEHSMGLQHARSPRGFTLEDRETGSLIANIFNNQTANNPQARIEQLLREAANRDEARLRIAQDIREALQRIRGANVGPVN